MTMVWIKRRRMLIAVGIALLLGAGISAAREVSFRLDRYKCRNNMRYLHWCAVMEYNDRNLVPTPDLKSVLLNLPWGADASALVCPGTGQKPGSLKNMEDWMSYVYIDWAPYFGTKKPPDDYPLLYDKSMANHKGRGINVCLVGGGVVIWDEEAKWLKAFAAEHPEYKIRIPQ